MLDLFGRRSSTPIIQKLTDDLDGMITCMIRNKHPWNFEYMKHLVSMTRTVCEEMKDYELYHVLIDAYILPVFWQLQPSKKWQPISLILDYFTNGSVMNDMGRQMKSRTPLSVLHRMISACPDRKTGHFLKEFLVYYK